MKNIIISFFILSFILVSCKPSQQKIDEMLQEAIEKIQRSDNKSAIEELDKIISYQEDNSSAYFYRANAKLNLKQSEEALKDYSKAIELKPDYADAFFNRGNCKHYMGDRTGACNDWNKAAALGKANVSDMLNYCN